MNFNDSLDLTILRYEPPRNLLEIKYNLVSFIKPYDLRDMQLSYIRLLSVLLFLSIDYVQAVISLSVIM